MLDFSAFTLQIAYAASSQRSAVSYRNPFVAVKIGSRQLIVERAKASRDFSLQGSEITEFTKYFLQGTGPEAAFPAGGTLVDLAPFEALPEGLQDYY